LVAGLVLLVGRPDATGDAEQHLDVMGDLRAGRREGRARQRRHDQAPGGSHGA
jgi:hypothetical protein